MLASNYLNSCQGCKYSLRGAFQCIAQPNTTLLYCILYLMQYLYDPGIFSSSADESLLGNVYLQSHLSRERFPNNESQTQEMRLGQFGFDFDPGTVIYPGTVI